MHWSSLPTRRIAKIMMMRSIKILLILLCCIVALPCMAAKDAVEDYARLSKLSSEELLRLGREYYNLDNPNQAYTCLSIISERYDPGMKPEEAELCLRAINNIGCIYRYFYYDYAQSFEWFSRGLAICDENDNEYMRLILMSNLCEILDEYAERYGSKQMDEQAKGIMDRCIVGAYNSKNWDIMVGVFFNMTNLSYDADVRKYQFIFSEEIPDSIDNLKYVRLQYRAIEAMQQHQYAKARGFFEQQLGAIDVEEQPERNVIPAYLNIAKTYEMEGNMPKAIALVDTTLLVAQRDSISDYKLICYKLLSEYHRKAGNEAMARENYVRYLEEKELLQASHLVGIGEMSYIQQLKQEEKKANEMAARQRRQLILIIFGSILLLITGGYTMLLYNKNRQLRFSNKSLFEKNQEVMKVEEAEQQLRKQYEQKLQLYHEEQEQAALPEAEQTEQPQESAQEPEPSSLEAEKADAGQPAVAEKYSRSNLSDEYKQTLIYRIQDVLNSPDIICQNDFSLAKLAKLVGSNTAYVSQVINEKTGNTFSIVVGKYRIKEACRRMNDTKTYGNQTIESISEGVGFKSRSTFVNAFKRQIGLTPSEYIKMASNQ